MLRIEVEFDSVDAGLGAPAVTLQPQAAEGSLLEALTDWWALRVADPFAKTSLDVRLPPLDIRWRFADQPITFGVRFDEHILEDLAEASAAFGWEALDDLHNAEPTGEAWTFTVPTSLVYLDKSSTPLPPLNTVD
jgi:hypothetical protein